MNEQSNIDDNNSNGATLDKKTCFILMPIADHVDYPTGHFKRVYDYLIKPACELAGLKPYRADDNKASDMIMIDILQKLVECDMAICDISSRNANVFFELGLRQAFNKKTILITDGTQVPPFDISGLRNVSYSRELRVDTVDIEVQKIAEMLTQTEKLSDDKVNSVVKLLQIRPAKVESKELGQMDSVVFSMFSDLKKQIADLSPANNVRIGGLRSPSTFAWTTTKNVTPSKIFAPAKGDCFDDIYKFLDDAIVMGEWVIDLSNQKNIHDIQALGKFVGREDDMLVFELQGRETHITNTVENRKKITVV